MTFFAAQFFDPGDQVSAVLAGLAVFAVGFVARPVGGLVVGPGREGGEREPARPAA